MNFEAACSIKQSVRYGFGTAAFIVPVLGANLHANRRKKGDFISPYSAYRPPYSCCKFLGTFFTVRTVRTVRLSVHSFRGWQLLGFFQTNSSTEFEGRDKY
jgi:hypothetical protein